MILFSFMQKSFRIICIRQSESLLDLKQTDKDSKEALLTLFLHDSTMQGQKSRHNQAKSNLSICYLVQTHSSL